MITYHCSLKDECGHYFSVSVDALNKDAAREELWLDYPESRVQSVMTIDEIREEERQLRF